MIIKKQFSYILEVIGLLVFLLILVIIPSFQGVGDNIFVGVFNKKDGSIYVALIITWIIRASLFYTNIFYLIPQFLSKRFFLKYTLFVFILYGGCSLLHYGLKEWLKFIYHLPEALDELYNQPITHRRDIGMPLWIGNFITLIFSFLYRFTRDWMKHETYKRRLTEEKLKTELQFLRSQINPHFLFNTLNGIYAITKRNQDTQAAQSIEKLSSLMRFMLYESNADFISLTKEVDYIHNMIEMQQLRFEKEELVVNFIKKGFYDNTLIAPILLIPLVENAFKHGVDIRETSIIKIELEVKNNELKFKVKNRKSRSIHSVSIDSSGIGLENLKKRLMLIYPKQHQLDIYDNNGNFEVILTIRFL